MASKLAASLDWCDRTYQKMDETQHSRFADLENVSSNEIGPSSARWQAQNPIVRSRTRLRLAQIGVHWFDWVGPYV